jgi:hypothetical protein
MTLNAATRDARTIATPMSINPDAIGFLRKRLRLALEDVLIFLREFTQNALDAGATRIEWCYVNVNGVDKIAIVDNGPGFLSDMMEGHITGLYNSGREQGVGKNFGIGGKTSGTAFSPDGVEYFTRCAGETHFRHALLVDNDDMNGGLVGEPDGTGITIVTRRDVPAAFANHEHGTMVIFHGTGPDHDTTAPPDGALGGRDWVARFLNMRYYTLDKNVKLVVKARKVRNGNETNTTVIQGVCGVLDKHEPTPQSGSVTLRVPDIGNVTVRWHLDHVGCNTHSSNGREQHGTQIASIYQGECYDRPRDATGNRARLAYFGIRAAAERVSLFIELPEATWQPNESRSQITRHGAATSPDWVKIGGCFQAVMPDVLAKAERDATRTLCNDARGDWRNELEQYLSTVATWRFDVNGAERAAIDQPGTCDRAATAREGTRQRAADRLAPARQDNRHGNTPGDDLARLTRPRNGGDVPRLLVVRASDMDDEHNATEWRREMNVLYVNETSPAWRSLIAAAQRLTIDTVGSDDVAHEAACHAAGLILAGQVINAELTRRDPNLPTDERQRRYDEATSAATLSVLLQPSPATTCLVRQRLASVKRLSKTV